jgi:hypothetical protein
MGDWILNLPVPAMAAVLLVATWLGTAVIYVSVTRLATGERARAFKAISPGILPPLSLMFALLVGFLAAQDWGDVERAHTAVNREASSLRAVVLLADAFPAEPAGRLRKYIQDHIEDIVAREWPAMARGDATLTMAPPRLAEALRMAILYVPSGEGQVAAQRELISALGDALDARRQRIILSHSSINWVKWNVLLLEAALTLVAIAMIHSDNPRANRIILFIFSTSIGLAVLLLASHSGPFNGQISVQPTVLQQVMPEATATQPSG